MTHLIRASLRWHAYSLQAGCLWPHLDLLDELQLLIPNLLHPGFGPDSRCACSCRDKSPAASLYLQMALAVEERQRDHRGSTRRSSGCAGRRYHRWQHIPRWSGGCHTPIPKEVNRSFHMCVQDVQITRTANSKVNSSQYYYYCISRVHLLQNDPWIWKRLQTKQHHSVYSKPILNGLHRRWPGERHA
jgi:hypothetical protein